MIRPTTITRRRKAVADAGFLDLPDVRQIHDYDCGAATARSVAVYFGVDDGRTEDDFIRELGTTPTSMIENGTAWQSIVDWFRRAGLEATPQRNMTLDDLKAHWRAGRPVIVALQDYGSLADYAKNESGHYVTVCGFVGDDVIIQDPSADNAEAGGRLPDHFPDSIQDFGKLMVRGDTFMAVWHDVDASGDVLTRFGICVGRPPAKGRKNIKDDSGHEHASDTGQFTSGGGGASAKPENKLPGGGDKPAKKPGLVGAEHLWDGAAKMPEEEYQELKSKTETVLASASKAELAAVWANMGMVGPTSPAKIMQAIEDRRGSYVRAQSVYQSDRRGGGKKPANRLPV